MLDFVFVSGGGDIGDHPERLRREFHYCRPASKKAQSAAVMILWARFYSSVGQLCISPQSKAAFKQVDLACVGVSLCKGILRWHKAGVMAHTAVPFPCIVTCQSTKGDIVGLSLNPSNT